MLPSPHGGALDVRKEFNPSYTLSLHGLTITIYETQATAAPRGQVYVTCTQSIMHESRGMGYHHTACVQDLKE
jgi:hypothetical protein